MDIEFSKIKESEISRIMWHIKMDLGTVGRLYADDTYHTYRYNPELADFSKYPCSDKENTAALKKLHEKLVRLFYAQSLEELFVDIDIEFRIRSRIFESEGQHSEGEYLSFYREYSDRGADEASYLAGVLEFAGFGCESDPERAFLHFLKCSEVSDKKARTAWIKFFINEPKGEGEVPEFYQDYVKAGFVATKDYKCPLRYYQPEWFVLQTLCANTPDEFTICVPEGAEAANELFELHQYYRYADGPVSDPDLPNFAFKPLGFEIFWYEDQKAMSMNLPLTLEQLRHILRLCIQYVIDNKCWRRGE